MNKTTYKSLADNLFNKIKDNQFCNMDENIAYEIAIEYIEPAIVRFQSCTQDLEDRDDVFQEFNFKLDTTNRQLLVNYMVLEWLESNYIMTSMALKARLSTTDFHSLQLPTQLAKAMELYSKVKKETDQLSKNYTYKKKNSKLYDTISNRGKAYKKR